MSVINNVLKDLENKPPAFTSLDLDMQSRQVAAKPRQSFVWVFAAAIIMVPLFIAYSTDWTGVQPAPRAALSPQSAVEAAPETTDTHGGKAAPVIDPVPVSEPNPRQRERNAIIGIQINETASIMELEFRMAGPVQSFLSERSRNHYVFMVRDVDGSFPAPEITHNPWLAGITLKETEPGLDIRFDTRDNVLVESRSRDTEAGHYWVIRLKKQAPADEFAPAQVSRVAQGGATPTAKSPPAVLQSQADTVAEVEAPVAPVKLRIRPASVEKTEAQRLQDATRLTARGQLLEAQSVLEQLLGGDYDLQARLRLIALLEKRNESSRRDELIRSSRVKYPRDEELAWFEAGQLFNRKNYRAVIEQFAGKAERARMLNLVGASYQRLGVHGDAIKLFGKALKKDANQPKIWISLGISLQHEKQPDKALHAYRMARRTGLSNARLLAFVEQRIVYLTADR